MVISLLLRKRPREVLVRCICLSRKSSSSDERKHSVVWRFVNGAIIPSKWLGCFTRQYLFSQVKLLFHQINHSQIRLDPFYLFSCDLVTNKSENWFNFNFQADILVRGYGGYNTRWALFLLHHLFPLESTKPPLATAIFFGANDSALSGRTSERQHVPIQEYKHNLQKMVLRLKVLFFISIY